jgi:hypothetical protein
VKEASDRPDTSITSIRVLAGFVPSMTGPTAVLVPRTQGQPWFLRILSNHRFFGVAANQLARGGRIHRPLGCVSRIELGRAERRAQDSDKNGASSALPTTQEQSGAAAAKRIRQFDIGTAAAVIETEDYRCR